MVGSNKSINASTLMVQGMPISSINDAAWLSLWDAQGSTQAWLKFFSCIAFSIWNYHDI